MANGGIVARLFVDMRKDLITTMMSNNILKTFDETMQGLR